MNEQNSAGCRRGSSVWTWRDRLGAIKVRFGIRRMSYAVQSGLYAVGAPGPDSPVFVTANYKLSFDHLRRALRDITGWILVLDTKAVNVWCAASEGNFSAAELVRRLREVQLDEVVSHRKLILPQLSAPGVNAFEVTRLSGFHVVYGPVYARDIPRFLAAGNTASPEMRRIHFRWHERLAVAPLELVIHFRRMLLTGVALAFLSGVTSSGFSPAIVILVARAEGRGWIDGGKVAEAAEAKKVSLFFWTHFRRSGMTVCRGDGTGHSGVAAGAGRHRLGAALVSHGTGLESHAAVAGVVPAVELVQRGRAAEGHGLSHLQTS